MVVKQYFFDIYILKSEKYWKSKKPKESFSKSFHWFLTLEIRILKKKLGRSPNKKWKVINERKKIAIKNYCPKRHKEGKGPKTQKVYTV